VLSKNPETCLLLKRIVRFGDTDAAGVLHFHNLLRWCHEAWEESLDKYGLNASDVFPTVLPQERRLQVALPVVHCEGKFKLPIETGDHLKIILLPEKTETGCFQVHSKFQREGQSVAFGLIRHLAINAETRKRCPLPENINLWIEASNVNLGPKPL